MKFFQINVLCFPVSIISLKREIRSVGEESGLQPVTIAMAFVYFEKLVLQGHMNKQNRKLVTAACLLLAAKISSDLKKQEVKQLIDVSVFFLHLSLILISCFFVSNAKLMFFSFSVIFVHKYCVRSVIH